MDGVARGNPTLARGGGILSNHVGNIIFPFSSLYYILTYTTMKSMAIQDGFLLCKECNLHNIILVFDSRLSIDIFQVLVPNGKSIKMDIIKFHWRITAIMHQLHGWNCARDVIATHVVCSHLWYIFSRWQSRPSKAQG